MGDLARAVFLDRDGTLNVEKHYLSQPEELELFEGVPESLSLLQSAGMELFVVTNQSGIGRGYFSEEDMHRVHDRLCSMLRPYGVTFRHIYFAPEVPGQPSYGRKPSPQFLWDAARDYRLDLKQSFMIGDKLCDLQCGWAAGVATSILVRTGYGAQLEQAGVEPEGPFHRVHDLPEAADWILQRA
ncbi:MAG: HAD family hydrolase [Verrucomicrobiales bacterium]